LSVTFTQINVIKSQTVKANQILHYVQKSHLTGTGILAVLSTVCTVNRFKGSGCDKTSVPGPDPHRLALLNPNPIDLALLGNPDPGIRIDNPDLVLGRPGLVKFNTF
jgi:hypothetical protein